MPLRPDITIEDVLIALLKEYEVNGRFKDLEDPMVPIPDQFSGDPWNYVSSQVHDFSFRAYLRLGKILEFVERDIKPFGEDDVFGFDSIKSLYKRLFEDYEMPVSDISCFAGLSESTIYRHLRKMFEDLYFRLKGRRKIQPPVQCLIHRESTLSQEEREKILEAFLYDLVLIEDANTSGKFHDYDDRVMRNLNELDIEDKWKMANQIKSGNYRTSLLVLAKALQNAQQQLEEEFRKIGLYDYCMERGCCHGSVMEMALPGRYGLLNAALIWYDAKHGSRPAVYITETGSLHCQFLGSEQQNYQCQLPIKPNLCIKMIDCIIDPELKQRIQEFVGIYSLIEEEIESLARQIGGLADFTSNWVGLRRLRQPIPDRKTYFNVV
ncbi:helix-turn-helix transcriptional regulator [Candidatus Woesearchaeota archaeon]|nr:helix-turn-helix transcriptional regulator [Candidatus Woesearchaeota archaeon]